MQYIDAGMVGSLGRDATAAIGLISTSTWLIGGLCISVSVGFSVQVAQLMLGRPYTLGGEVVESRRIGRSIGFPLSSKYSVLLIRPVRLS